MADGRLGGGESGGEYDGIAEEGMNRFQQLWAVLRGGEEFFGVKPPERVEVQVPVIGDTHLVTLYCTYVPSEDGPFIVTCGGVKRYLESIAVYYATCAEAHAANPERSVSAVQAIRVGDQYFVGDVKPVNVQPKPKRAKGKAST
jgi:hypothetical protein